jgi:GNAT superfamily N-acetyltransferase
MANIRPATAGDMDRLQRLDASYATNYVWQIEESSNAEQIGLSMRRVRTPRPVEVSYHVDAQGLFEDYRCGECLLLADDLGALMGYIDMTLQQAAHRQGWIEHLVVHRPFRRLGVGTQLLRAAEAWALANGIGSIMAIVPTRNDPAQGFFSQRGYARCGFIESYRERGDMSLLYSRKL